MRIELRGGPLDGVTFEHAQGLDKLLLLTDGEHLLRYETEFEETIDSDSRCVMYQTPAPAEFDFELISAMKRVGRFR
ncbi:MAG: hypothetical protein H0T51_15170 [Pirellulales bacterium]|nr:hypothetical protein [Pirellulales bacterium]